MTIHLRSEIAQIPDPDDKNGRILYRRFRARLPHFLTEYSPKEGYRMERRTSGWYLAPKPAASRYLRRTWLRRQRPAQQKLC